MLVRRTNSLLDHVIDEWNRAVDEKVNSSADKTLALDVYEAEAEYTIQANLPGINPENIDIHLEDNTLTIRAEVVAQEFGENQRVLIQERHYGVYTRTLRFPLMVNGDAIEAEYNNGVLSIHVPKAEEVKPRRITINTARNN